MWTNNLRKSARFIGTVITTLENYESPFTRKNYTL